MSYPILFKTKSAERAAAIADIAIADISIVDDDGSVESYVSPSDLDLDTQGQGTLSDAISCEVTEERNGSYELEMQYPISGIHFEEIEARCFILAKPNYTDDPQLFRIYKITKPLNGICTIYAQHISYDMSGYYIPGGLTAASLTAAVTLFNQYCSPFTINSTKTGTAEFATDVPASVRSWLGGKKGSFLDLYGGEWHWDNFDATLSTSRGANRGVTIRYGKNLTAFESNVDSSNLYTAVLAYHKDNEGTLTVGTAVSTGLTLDTDRVYFLDMSSAYVSGTTPTAADLTRDATDYISNNNLTIPAENIELDFVQLQGLAERVDLCDTATIEWENMGVSATAKCIKATWDVLKERYTSCTFGTARSTLADTVNGIIEAANSSMNYLRGVISNTQSTLESDIASATAKITGNLGGYVIIHDSDNDGKPDEILIMDTPSIATATKVWRWNKNGLGYSSTGYSGSYSTAITADGKIVADFVATGVLNANLITTGTMQGASIKLGGANDGYGILEIYGDDGLLEGRINQNGHYIYRDGTFMGQFTNLYVEGADRMTVSCGQRITSVDFRFNDGTEETPDFHRRFRFFRDTAYGMRMYNASGGLRGSMSIDDSTDGGRFFLYDTNNAHTVYMYGATGRVYAKEVYVKDENDSNRRLDCVYVTSGTYTYNNYGCYNTGLDPTVYTIIAARCNAGSSVYGLVLVPFVAYQTWWIKAYDWNGGADYSGSKSTVFYYIKRA